MTARKKAPAKKATRKKAPAKKATRKKATTKRKPKKATPPVKRKKAAPAAKRKKATRKKATTRKKAAAPPVKRGRPPNLERPAASLHLLGVKLPKRLIQELGRTADRRKEVGLLPCTRATIVEAAVSDWLKRNPLPRK